MAGSVGSGKPTTPMRQVGAGGGPASLRPGLVLLFAEEHESLPPAWPLDAERVVIGREPPADLLLPVGSVSRTHAEVLWDGDRWLLRDLDSTNGTFVEGERIDQMELEPNLEIRIGDAVLKFVEKHADAHARYRLDGTLVGGAQRRSPGSALLGGWQMDRIAADLGRIAPTELSVVLRGESGTGKEVVARELHRQSGRRGDFCAVNCAAIPATLLESELFGYKRGAFSGADRDKPGLIKSAHDGTLLLDEIGDMPLDAQAKLLRVLQNKEVFPLGATTPERVDVRVVCATHRDLDKLQTEGRFRQDLFGRLNEYQLKLPPLRDRKEDVLMLVRAFLARHGRPELRPSFSFMLALLLYDWPYNVRELEGCIKRSIALADGTVLGTEQLPDVVREALESFGSSRAPRSVPPPGAVPREDRGGTPSEAELRALLQTHAGNVAAVGRELGKARMQIHRWMKRYGIEIDDYR